VAVDDIAAAHARRQVALGRRVAEEIGRLWRLLLDLRDIAASWARAVPRALGLMTAGQTAAAADAGSYIGAVAGAYGIRSDPAGRIVPSGFAGTASDGRDMTSLLYLPAITVLTRIAEGVDVDRAAASGAAELDMIARTQVADAGRVADGVAIASQPRLSGYIRMIVGDTCSRCIVLAGRWYEWNAGFQRHPRCDCIHIPASEDTADEVLTNPAKIFESMSAAEQDRVFTIAGAQAIRDGADISQVVNARRGARGLTPAGARITAEEARILRGGRDRGRLERTSVFGRDVFTTTEGRTVRGVAGKRLSRRGTERVGRYRSAKAARLMPESIYELAEDREDAIRLLRYHGYIL
jgi:hypothetical protein